MLTKGKKVVMTIFCVVAIILGILTAIPFRVLQFINSNENLFLIEGLLKYIIIPLILVGISIYPMALKYGEINNNRERSKIINVMCYLPVILYLVGLLLFLAHTLTFKEYPMSNSARAILLTITIFYLVFIILASFNLNKFSMQLKKKGNIIFDCIFGAVTIIFILLAYRIISTYNDFFKDYDSYLYSSSNDDPYLFVLIIVLVVGVVSLAYLLSALFKADEALIYAGADSETELNKIAETEYNRAYNDALDRFEIYFTNGLSSDKKAAEEAQVSETVATPEANDNSSTEEPVETSSENSTEEVTNDNISSDPSIVDEQHSLDEALEIVSIINETELEDEFSAEKIIDIKTKIDSEKDILVSERTSLENLRAQYASKIDELEAKVKEIEVNNIKAELENSSAEEEEIKPIKKKVFKPTFEQVLEFATSLQEEDWKIINKIDPEKNTGIVKFSKGKVLFLILQNTSSDYRITFLTTEKKWSSILTGVKGVSIPKNAKGDKWLKFVNKGIGETSTIKSLIRESVKGATEEINLAIAKKEAEKAKKAAERKAAKEQAKLKLAEAEN